MFLFIKWKLDLESENKLVILDISKEKQDSDKYVISNNLNLLDKIKIKYNFDNEQIYWTRINIGNIQNNTLYLLVIEKYSLDNKIYQIDIFITNSKKSRTQLIKSNMSNPNNYDFLSEQNYSNYVNNAQKISKLINKDNYGEFHTCIGDIYKYRIFDFENVF